jgi:small subunit ribosomal protein S13
MRIAGITLEDKKQVRYGLTSVYGIGLSRSASIAEQAQVNPMKKVGELTEEEEKKIRALVEKFTIEGELRREISQNVKRLKDVQSYRGSRHARNLPVHGQRTKTNSRTVRGNKRSTMASGRRKESKT